VGHAFSEVHEVSDRYRRVFHLLLEIHGKADSCTTNTDPCRGRNYHWNSERHLDYCNSGTK